MKVLKKKFSLKKELSDLLDKFKIKKGNSIVLHSNSAGLFQYGFQKKNEVYETFINTLIERVGASGTIIIPTYNYDFTKNKLYDKNKTLSKVGLFSNFLLKKKSFYRTYDPIFSHIVIGKDKNKIEKCKISECFGDKSIFSHMHKLNYKIICFCCSPNKITFIHYIEKNMMVNYRYNKIFNGYIKKKNKKIKIKIKYNVGDLNCDYSLKNHKILKLLKKNQFMHKRFGRFNSYCVTTKYLYNIIKTKLKKNNNFLIK